ncbi:PR domain zinc finger protein 1 [Gossypium arboreum]|uniref:PR domain zinc finger protein 1 n=1 Tax=Gossypium arboreum TaxID=29729 RepID=A0A0B0MKD7_GOSAR|nr:PR domain zinc finger protein 1 [Gossypium arboreum]
MDLTERDGNDEGKPASRSTKKVRIREIEENQDVAMEATQEIGKSLSWKDRLMGRGLYSNEKTTIAIGFQELQVNSIQSSPMEATSRASNIGRSVSNSRNDYRKESDSLSKTEILEKLTQDLPSIPNPSSIIESPSHDNHSNLINPGKNIGETIKDCPAQSSLQTMQESIKISTSGFLDAAKHSAVLFKDDSQSTTKGHTQKNRAKTGFHHAELTATRGVLKARNSRKVKNLKVNKEKGNPFKSRPGPLISNQKPKRQKIFIFMDLTPLDCNNIQKAHSKILSAIPLEALVVVVLSQKAEAAVAATLVLGARATVTCKDKIKFSSSFPLCIKVLLFVRLSVVVSFIDNNFVYYICLWSWPRGVWVLEVIVILDSENEKGNCNAILAICSRLGIGYWDLVGIGSKLHVNYSCRVDIVPRC